MMHTVVLFCIGLEKRFGFRHKTPVEMLRENLLLYFQE